MEVVGEERMKEGCIGQDQGFNPRKEENGAYSNYCLAVAEIPLEIKDWDLKRSANER